MATPGLAASHQSQALWDKPGIKKLFQSTATPSSGAINAAMSAGLGRSGIDKIADYYGRNRTMAANPAARSSSMNTMVTGNKYVTGGQERGVVPRESAVKFGDVGLKPIDPSKVDVYAGLDKVQTPAVPKVKPSGTKGGSKGGSKVTGAKASDLPAAAAATVVAPEVTNAGNDASVTLAGYNPVYASGGTSLYANPFSATMDAGYPQESIDGSALDYGTYKPGQSVLGRDTVFGDPTQYKNPEQVWNTSVNPEGQYTNLAGDGTVSLANPAASGYDFNMKDVASGVEALSGAANAYLGFKNYGLAKDMYGFQKGVANRNIANLATEHNADLRNRLDVGLSLAGNTKNPDMIAKADSTYASGSISGAPIK